MIRFEMDFESHSLEKPLIRQTKEDIRARLEGHEIGSLKIVLKKRPGRQIALQFHGDPENVEKAKRLLGIY
jgi:hypothetical protein